MEGSSREAHARDPIALTVRQFDEARCRAFSLTPSQRRERSYLLTAMLACRSVGRTIGNGGLVTTSLTQRASPPLK